MKLHLCIYLLMQKMHLLFLLNKNTILNKLFYCLTEHEIDCFFLSPYKMRICGKSVILTQHVGT